MPENTLLAGVPTYAYSGIKLVCFVAAVPTYRVNHRIATRSRIRRIYFIDNIVRGVRAGKGLKQWWFLPKTLFTSRKTFGDVIRQTAPAA